jgi:hypothetical protein
MKRLIYILLLLPIWGFGQDTIDYHLGGSSYTDIYVGSFNNKALGNTFTCNGSYVIDSCVFKLRKSGSPTGNAYAKLYEMGAGTYGTDGRYSGAGDLLATSDVFDIATLTTTGTEYVFRFTGANKVSVTSDYYVIMFESYNGNSTNKVQFLRNASDEHDGNLVSETPLGGISGNSGSDAYFIVYGTPSIIEKKNIFMGINF